MRDAFTEDGGAEQSAFVSIEQRRQLGKYPPGLVAERAGQAVQEVIDGDGAIAARKIRQGLQHVGANGLRPVTAQPPAGRGQGVRVNVQQVDGGRGHREPAMIGEIAGTDADLQMPAGDMAVVQRQNPRRRAAPHPAVGEAEDIGVVNGQQSPVVDGGAGGELGVHAAAPW